MPWSQIKLTSYDFSDLHITGEFDNRPDTGTKYSSSRRCRTVPGRRCYRSAEFSRAIIYTFISKLANIP